MYLVAKGQPGPHGALAEGVEQAADANRLDLVVQRLVDAADPDRIILFGSAARGETGPDSDLDLLLVKAQVTNAARLYDAIYSSLIGVGQAVDVLIVSPEDLERYRDSHALVIKPALQEGKTIYVRCTEPRSSQVI